MAISEVGSGSQRSVAFANGVASLNNVYPGNVTSGNLLICAGQVFNSSPGAPASVAITDTRSTSYTVDTKAWLSFERYFIGYALAPSSGADTVTVDPSNATDDLTYVIDEFSGVSASTPLDVAMTALNTGTGTAVTVSITTTTDNALIIGVMGIDGTTTTITEDFTLIGEHEDNVADEALSVQFRLAGAAGTYSMTWTLGASRTWQAYAIAFRAETTVAEEDQGWYPTESQTSPTVVSLW